MKPDFPTRNVAKAVAARGGPGAGRVTDVAKAVAARDSSPGAGRAPTPKVAEAATLIREIAGVARPDVLLVRPWAPSAAPADGLVDDALGVGYLAASLRAAGISAGILDAFTFGFGDAEVAACAVALAPRVMGISLHSFADYEHSVAIAEGVRKRRPDIFIVAGGEHATFLARSLLERHPTLDAVVLAEGEETIVDLAGRALRGEPWAGAPGAMTRDDRGAIVDGGTRPAIADLDAIPDPAKDVVEIATRLGRPVAVSLLSGRGCTHRCTFCTAHAYLRLGGGRVWRRRRPEAVVAELASLVERFAGRPAVHPMLQFQDVVFLGASRAALGWVERFVEEMERLDLRAPFYVMARAEAVIANAALLPRLARRGLASIEIGIESGVDRILEAYDKRSSVDQTLEAIGILRTLGIAYDASGFIMFDPRMTLDDVRTNADFLERIDHATWDRFVTRLQVFPGTAIRDELRTEGLLLETENLGDVYGYRFLDPRVGVLASRVGFFDASLRALDDAVRAGRRYQEAPAQSVCRSFFHRLADLAARGTLEASFELEKRRFLQVVRDSVSAAGRRISDRPASTMSSTASTSRTSPMIAGVST